MPTNQTATLKGQFLLAMPSLLDPNFYQTVTCICEHNENGAMGIIVIWVFVAVDEIVASFQISFNDVNDFSDFGDFSDFNMERF